jgi:hypothetical protein
MPMLTLHVSEALLSLSFLLGGAAALLQLQPRAAQIARMHFPLPPVAVRVNARHGRGQPLSRRLPPSVRAWKTCLCTGNRGCRHANICAGRSCRW